MQPANPEVGIREVMRRYPTGVTIVASIDEAGRPVGLTVNSFTSVSLDPPLILVCIGSQASSHDRLIAAGRFSVNVLAVGQDDLARRFAREPSEGRFEAITWAPGPYGSPLIEGAAAWMDCSLENVFPGGDHSILVGRARASGLGNGSALLYHAGSFGSVAP